MTTGNEHAILSQPGEMEEVGLEVWGWQRSQVRGQGQILWGLALGGGDTPKLRDVVTQGGRGRYPNRELACVAASWGEDINGIFMLISIVRK